MTHPFKSKNHRQAALRVPGRSAFTLIELMVVVAIIALLIGILMPALQAARNQAKDAKTRALLKNIGEGLQLFRNNHEKEFRASNGYPPSAKGPDIHEENPPATDYLYGAHWLPRHLMGKDSKGFVSRKAVPPSLDNPDDRKKWYDPDPLENGSGPLDRDELYINIEGIQLVPTNELQGTFPSDTSMMDPDLRAPVIVDTHNRPVLYYVANPLGKAIAQPACGQGAPDAGQSKGVYVHEDNWGFTGKGPEASEEGFLFSLQRHKIEEFGFTQPETIDTKPYSFTFYIHDHAVHEQTTGEDETRGTVRAVRSDSYLLITAGKDGVYGTPDDVDNFEQKH